MRCVRHDVTELYYYEVYSGLSSAQVCLELTSSNRTRELRGVIEGARLRGRRRAIVVTVDQADRLVEDGVEVDVVRAWQWMA